MPAKNAPWSSKGTFARIPSRCVYCGHRCRKQAGRRPATCSAHSDLPRLDPFYNDVAEVA